MAFPEKHALVTFGGTLANGAESWTCGIRMRSVAPVGIPDQADLATYLPNLKDKVALFWNAIKDMISSNTKLVWMKANAIETNGKYSTGAVTNLYTWTTPIAGTASLIVPSEISLAVSTRTAVPRGRAHAGRFYLPTPGIATGADGLYSVTETQYFADQAAIFLSNLSDATDVLTVNMLRPAVFSNLGSGSKNDITSVAVGRVPDVQRSRRRQLVEAHRTHTVTY